MNCKFIVASLLLKVLAKCIHLRIQRGGDGGTGRGSGPPPLPENHKAIGFPSNTGPDPLRNHQATKLDHHRPSSNLNVVSQAGQ